MAKTLPINEEITKEQWMDRFIHMAEKLAIINGINEQEMQWVRDCGYECGYENDED